MRLTFGPQAPHADFHYPLCPALAPTLPPKLQIPGAAHVIDYNFQSQVYMVLVLLVICLHILPVFQFSHQQSACLDDFGKCSSDICQSKCGGRQIKATFTLIRVRVRVLSAGFSLRLVQASPIRVSVHSHLYKDNSTRVYRQSPEKSNRENALRKSNNIPLNR